MKVKRCSQQRVRGEQRSCQQTTESVSDKTSLTRLVSGVHIGTWLARVAGGTVGRRRYRPLPLPIRTHAVKLTRRAAPEHGCTGDDGEARRIGETWTQRVQEEEAHRALVEPVIFASSGIHQPKELRLMAGTTGLEPATSAVTGQRSNQLSYVPRG